MEGRDRIELLREAWGWKEKQGKEKQGKEKRARQCIRVRMANMVGCLIRPLLVQEA